MSDEEAQQLSNHPDIQFIHIDPSSHPEMFPTDVKDDLHCATRYNSNVKNYRNFSGLLPGSPNSTDGNRAGYQLLRTAQYANPWQGQSASTILSNTVPITNTGKNIDVVVSGSEWVNKN